MISSIGKFTGAHVCLYSFHPLLVIGMNTAGMLLQTIENIRGSKPHNAPTLKLSDSERSIIIDIKYIFQMLRHFPANKEIYPLSEGCISRFEMALTPS